MSTGDLARGAARRAGEPRAHRPGKRRLLRMPSRLERRCISPARPSSSPGDSIRANRTAAGLMLGISHTVANVISSLSLCGSLVGSRLPNAPCASDPHPPTDMFRGTRHLIVDPDTKYSSEFRTFLARMGVHVIRLPPRSPNLNAFAERFVRSVKSECLSKLIPIGLPMLRRAVHEYMEHYHRERNHRGIGNDLLVPRRLSPSQLARIDRRRPSGRSVELLRTSRRSERVGVIARYDRHAFDAGPRH